MGLASGGGERRHIQGATLRSSLMGSLCGVALCEFPACVSLSRVGDHRGRVRRLGFGGGSALAGRAAGLPRCSVGGGAGLVTGLGGAASSSEAGSTLLCGPSVAGVEVCVLRWSIVTCYPTLGTVGFRIFGVTVLVAGARAVVLCYVMLC